MTSCFPLKGWIIAMFAALAHSAHVKFEHSTLISIFWNYSIQICRCFPLTTLEIGILSLYILNTAFCYSS
jgi:hypothetical protein